MKKHYRFCFRNVAALQVHGIRFISIVMQLNSGDELKITCQQVEMTEDDL